MKIRFKFPEERSAFFLNHQHGRRDVTCKPAIKALKKRPLKIYPLELISEIPSTIDCKTVGFFLKISKEIGKVWRKSLTHAKRASITRP